MKLFQARTARALCFRINLQGVLFQDASCRMLFFKTIIAGRCISGRYFCKVLFMIQDGYCVRVFWVSGHLVFCGVYFGNGDKDVTTLMMPLFVI